MTEGWSSALTGLPVAAVLVGVLGGCAPMQRVEVQAHPPDARVTKVVDGETVDLGEAPVRFRERRRAPFELLIEAPDHEPERVEIPGGERVHAAISVALRPVGPLLHQQAVLELLLLYGPQSVAELAEQVRALSEERVEAAVEALVAGGELRPLDTTPPRYDLELAGLVRLGERLPHDAILERLLMSRRQLARRALAGGARGGERRRR